MMPRTFHRLSLEVPSTLVRPCLAALEIAGVQLVMVRNGKLSRLGTSRSFALPWQEADPLAESPAAQIWTWLDPEVSRGVLEYLAPAIGLDNPGRAAAYISTVELFGSPHALSLFNPGPLPGDARPPLLTLGSLAGISCILNRGEGQALVRAALELGTCVPVASYAQGLGLRDQLGLLRLAMPAAKEVIHLVVPDHDAPGILEHLIEDAKLNQPGKGFLSVCPIDEGVVNARIAEGKQRHVASMEQVISAIDILEGSTLWRRRFEGGSGWKYRYQRDMYGLSLIAAEGLAAPAAIAAMAAGANGATGSLVKGVASSELREEGFMVAREEAVSVVRSNAVEAVRDALYQSAAELDPFAFVEVQRRPLAYVYTR